MSTVEGYLWENEYMFMEIFNKSLMPLIFIPIGE